MSRIPHMLVAAMLTMALAPLARAQLADHLKCYQIKDSVNLAAVVNLDSPQFGVENGCKVSKAKFYCVPVSKTVVSAKDKKTKLPITPQPVGGPNPGERVCYSIKCEEAVADQKVTDQFGTRTMMKAKAALLCAPACTEAVLPVKSPAVDIVWVVDNSGSMVEERGQIEANINPQFADRMSASGLDYRVVMITDKGTGTGQVCVAPPLGGPDCGDNPPLYRAIDQVVGSTDSLSLVLSTYGSSNPSLDWSTSLRYDAVKVFIEVTDDNSALSAASFDTQLLAKQPAGIFGTAAGRNYVFHSIIGVNPGQPNLKCLTAVNTGAQYQVLSTLTGGRILSVCATDYSPIFDEIVNAIIGSVGCTFTMASGGGAGVVDFDKVVMRFTPSNGTPVDITGVQDASQCSGDGWYYDDNATPTKLGLCPDTCATVKADPGAKIEIVACANG